MIQIKNLWIWVEDKEIISWIDLKIDSWKNYLLLWKNWSWKSSLSNFLMWNPLYKHLYWEVEINWKNLIDMSVSERAAEWLFLSFQNVPEIPWVNLWEYLRTIYNNKLKITSPETMQISPFVFKRFIKKYLNELSLDENFLSRDLNVWFSGWEKRKLEILQVRLLEPKYIILDEIDSWLDLDSFKKVSSLISEINNDKNSIIVITHHFKIADYIKFDEVYVLKNWKIDKKWWIELLNEIQKNWFE